MAIRTPALNMLIGRYGTGMSPPRHDLNRRNSRSKRNINGLNRRRHRIVAQLAIVVTPPAREFRHAIRLESSARVPTERRGQRRIAKGRNGRDVRQIDRLHRARLHRSHSANTQFTKTVTAPAIQSPIPGRGLHDRARVRRPRSDLDNLCACPRQTEFTAAICIGCAFRSFGTSSTCSAAIDIDFSAVLHAVITSRRLARIHRAYHAHAIRTQKAAQSIATSAARRSPTIDIRFFTVFLHVVTRGYRAHPRRARLALTISARHAHFPSRTRLTVRTAAIDIRLVDILRLIRTRLHHTMIHVANEIHGTIRIECTFDTRTFSVTYVCPHPTARAGHCRLVRRQTHRRTRIDRALSAIIQCVGQIDDIVDAIPHTITLIDFAIANDLLQYRRSLGLEYRCTSIGDAYLFSAFGIHPRTIIVRRTRWRWSDIEDRIRAETVDTIDEMTRRFTSA
jgi:hypothetical protein